MIHVIHTLPYLTVVYLFCRFVYRVIDYVRWRRRQRNRRLGYITFRPKRHQ